MLARQAELKARSAPQNGNGSEVVFGDDVKPQVAGVRFAYLNVALWH